MATFHSIKKHADFRRKDTTKVLILCANSNDFQAYVGAAFSVFM